MLTAIIITKNEENKIRACLDSVRFADEIVVIDSGSSDRTVEICRSYTPHVFVMDWPGFGPQKQRALDRARGDWVLSIDADEVVPDDLRDEILEAITLQSASGYYIPRLSHFCGRPVRHGGWYPDHVLRLFRRTCGRFTADIVHERVLVEGELKKLQQPLLHYSYDSIEQAVDKLNHYSTLGARSLSVGSHRGGVAAAVVRGLFAFVRAYILRAGFLDGRIGFIVAVTSAETTYYKYLKLYFLSADAPNAAARLPQDTG